MDSWSVAVKVPDVTFTARRFSLIDASMYTVPAALEAACVTASPSAATALRKLA
jgi:hypothetical protein